MTKAGPITIRMPETLQDGSVEYTDGEHSVVFSMDTSKGSKGKLKTKEKKEGKLKKLEEGLAIEFFSDEEFVKEYGITKSESEYAEADINEIAEKHDQLMMTEDKVGSGVTYNSVMTDVDLRYTISGTVLKEAIVLNSAQAIQSKYEFTIASETLTPALKNDRSVDLLDENGNAVFTINAPYMYDAAGEVSEEIGVKVKTNSDGTYTYRLSPDKSWLKDNSRQYPVIIDPPVSESNFDTVKDTTGAFSNSAEFIDNATEWQTMKVGNMSHSGSIVEVQGMIYSALPAVLSSGTTKIINAKLMLVGHSYGYSDDLQVNAYRITSDWDTTDMSKYHALSLGSDGRSNYDDVLDYNRVSSSDFSNGDEDVTPFYIWDITEAAQEWLEGRSTNYGISLRAEDLPSGTEKYVRFFDSTIDASDATGCCPQFIYTYRDLRGVEDYWSFTSMTAGRFGTLGINNYNGNPVITQSLVSSTGNNMPVAVSLIYSFNSRDDGGSGLGAWRTNYHMQIEECDLEYKIGETVLATYKYVFIDSDGTRHYLRQEGTEHKDEDGLGLTMTVLEGETDYKYQIETKDKSVYKFDHAGRLNRVTDSNGNFNYVYFTNSTERVIDYIIEGSDASTTRRRTEFTYDDTNGDLQVTTPEGNYATVDFVSATNRSLTGIYYEDYGSGDSAGSGVTGFT